MDLSNSDGSDPVSDSAPEDSLVPPPNEEAFLSTTSLVCKQKPALMWILPLGVLEAAFFLAAPFLPDKQNPEGNLALAFLTMPVGLLMLMGIVFMAFDLWRGEIRADNKEITWRRGFGSFKSARWNEVTDYYRRFSPQGPRTLETPSGKLELSSSFGRVDELAELVTHHVPQHPTGAWMMRDSKYGRKWTPSLVYWSKLQRWTAPIITSLPLFLLGAAIYGAVTSPPHWPQYLDWGSILGMGFALIFGLLFSAGEVWMLIELWRERRFAWERRDEELTLNPQGLWYHSEKKQIQAKWGEVRTVSRVGEHKSPQRRLAQFRVETDKGDFFLWDCSNASVWTHFRSALKQYAPHTLENIERSEKESWRQLMDLEGERGAWSGGAVGVGVPQWSYRSRDTRFVLQLVSFFGGIAPVLYLLLSYNSSLSDPDVPYSPSWPTFVGMWVTSALVIGASGLWFRRAAILAHEDELEIRSPFHAPHRIAWTEIDSLDTDSFGRFLRARGRKFYLSRPFWPVRSGELESLIEQKRGAEMAVR